jgi:hypothetical protein
MPPHFFKTALIFSEEFLEIFKKADQDHNRGSGQAQEKHYFEQAYEEDREGHKGDCSAEAQDRRCMARVTIVNPSSFDWS